MLTMGIRQIVLSTFEAPRQDIVMNGPAVLMSDVPCRLTIHFQYIENKCHDEVGA
jgi:hypothetical protein